MQIELNKVVYFNYSLSEPEKDIIETSRKGDPMAYLHGHRNLMPALEASMVGKQQGDVFSVTLTPEQAYGHLRDDSKQRIPIKHVLTKGKLKLGMAIKINTDQGARDCIVVKVGRFNVDVDTNHPLADKTLVFDIEIIDLRDATPEEIDHKHVHGPGGHPH